MSNRHEERDRRTGRYVAGALCDYCGQPTGVAYCSDDEVCKGSDGPGFLLCSRKWCGKAREGLSVAARCALYTVQRAVNDGAEPPATELHVYGVLAAAYPGGPRSDPKFTLTHVAWGHELTALCGRVRPEMLADVEIAEPPTCTACARIVARLKGER